MINLHIIQSEFGDSLILESKLGNKSTNLLIDGGPYQTFANHLRPAIQKLLLHKKIDLMILSHIDNDHIIGLIDLLNEIKNQRKKKTKELVKISTLWHNSFKNLLLLPEEPINFIENIFRDQSSRNKKVGILEPIVMKGFQQGADLTKLAHSLKIPINPDFGGRVIQIDDKLKSISLNNTNLLILGPTKKNLDKLRREWNEWYSKKHQIARIGPRLTQILDKSVPNLASIMFLAKIKNRKILFTGDGLGEDIIEILSKNGMLDSSGKFHLDILKIPHHGSERNSTKEFFNTVTAEHYIISANGRDDNPSLDTLKWIIESENKYKGVKKIILTNLTPNVKKVLRKYDQKKFNYECIIMEKGSDFLTITL